MPFHVQSSALPNPTSVFEQKYVFQANMQNWSWSAKYCTDEELSGTPISERLSPGQADSYYSKQ